MAFDYNSRTKWEKERVDRWNKEHEKQVKNLSPAQQELFGEVRDFSSYPHCGFPVINKWSREKVKKDAGGRSLKGTRSFAPRSMTPWRPGMTPWRCGIQLARCGTLLSF